MHKAIRRKGNLKEKMEITLAYSFIHSHKSLYRWSNLKWSGIWKLVQLWEKM